MIVVIRRDEEGDEVVLNGAGTAVKIVVVRSWP